MKTATATGAIHWSRKQYLRTRQEAWRDVHVYEVPYTGTGDASRMRKALTTGAHDKTPRPWAGASGGVYVVAVDDTRKVATVEVSHPIMP